MNEFEVSAFDDLLSCRLRDVCDCSCVLMSDSGKTTLSVGHLVWIDPHWEMTWEVDETPVTAYDLARLVAWLYDPATLATPKDTIIQLLRLVVRNLTSETRFREQMRSQSPLAACADQPDLIEE